MKDVNAQGKIRTNKWYNNKTFPLIPLLDYTKGDKHNTTSITFKWLFFTFWTLDSFCIEFSIVASSHWGIGIIGILPYLRWVITIPCPISLEVWINKKLTIRPKNKDY